MGARAVLPYEGIDATAHAAVGEVVGRGAGERDDSREVRKRGVTSLCVGQTFLSAFLWPDRNVWPTWTTFLVWANRSRHSCLPPFGQTGSSGPHAHMDNLSWWANRSRQS